MKSRYCRTGVTCGEKLKSNATSEFCVNCRASINRWSHRPVSQIRDRRKNLQKYTLRMAEVQPAQRGRSYVVPEVS